MSELYLILHKVRGEPAFDIAEKTMIGKEEGWVIPTSGHRAYPTEIWDIANLKPCPAQEDGCYLPEILADYPWKDDWPDHYDSRRDDDSYMEDEARTILLRKGLLKAKPINNYRRR